MKEVQHCPEKSKINCYAWVERFLLRRESDFHQDQQYIMDILEQFIFLHNFSSDDIKSFINLHPGNNPYNLVGISTSSRGFEILFQYRAS